MAKKTLADLKTYFQRGDRPTQLQFEEMLESTLQELRATSGGLEISNSPTNTNATVIPFNDMNFWQQNSGDIKYPSGMISLTNNHKVDRILNALSPLPRTDALLTEKAIVEYVNTRTSSVYANATRNSNYSVVANDRSIQRGFDMTTEDINNGYNLSNDKFTAPIAGNYEFKFNTLLQNLSPAISSYFLELHFIVQRTIGSSTVNIFSNRFYRMPSTQDIALRLGGTTGLNTSRLGGTSERATTFLYSFDYSANPIAISYTRNMALQAGDVATVRLTASGLNCTFVGGASNTNFTIKTI